MAVHFVRQLAAEVTAHAAQMRTTMLTLEAVIRAAYIASSAASTAPACRAHKIAVTVRINAHADKLSQGLRAAALKSSAGSTSRH